MRCASCGEPNATKETREMHPYVGCGLDNVILEVAELRVCPDCGAEDLALRNVAALYSALAMAVTSKSARLAGQEVRFLRKFIGLSGQDFARTIGIDPTTVSRWENDKEPIGGTADRLLRLMARAHDPETDATTYDDFDAITRDGARLRLTARRKGSKWSAEAEAA